MASLLLFLLMLAVLFLPGLAWISVARCQYKESNSWALSSLLLSVSLSYALFAFVVVCARGLQFSYALFSTLVWAYLVVAAFAVVLVTLKKRFSKSENAPAPFNYSTWIEHGLVVAIIVFLGVYHLVFGAYTEIPADIYFHIEKFQQVYSRFSANELRPIVSISAVIKQDAEVWYHLLAWLAFNSGASVGQMVQTASLVSQSVFLLAVYTFAIYMFQHNKAVKWIACLAVLLVALHFGVSVFSFVRYYSLAPAMLAFVFYFAATMTVMGVLRQRNFTGILPNALLWLILLSAAILVHTQEAMFIAIHSSIILCSFAWILLRNSSGFLQNQASTIKPEASRRFDLTVQFLAFLVVAIFCIAYVFAHYQWVHFGNNGQRLLEFGPALGILPKLAILNPNYQFMQVVTLWGVLIYALFFLHWQRYKHNLLLVSGMLLPAFTVFNPFFTDLFLRLTDSTVLWRFCFLIPIYYVAADLIVLYAQRIFSINNTKNAKSAKSDAKNSDRGWQKITACLGLFAIGVLLLPFKNSWQDLHYSRYPTWRAVAEQQSYQHLADVFAVLSTQPEKKEVLTDPVTGYLLSGFTQHINYRDKFSITPYSGYKRFYFENYAHEPLKKFAGKLLLINQRTPKNGDSFVGALSRHWYPDLFKRIEPFYPDSLFEHVQNSPDRFELLFAQDDVQLYQIR